VKRFFIAALTGILLTGLAWPIAATPPYMQILIEDGSPYFVPVTATISSGNPIRWENPTPTHHTVTHNACADESGPCAFDSGTMPPGDAFSLPGLPPGRYAYHCRIHPIMRGMLTVTEASQMPSQL
jgi:plastocyanin